MTDGNPFLAAGLPHTEMCEDITQAEVRWQKRFHAFVEMLKLDDNLRGSSSHLDLGCGFGTFSSLLARRFPNTEIWGMDADKGRIDAGRKRYAEPNLHLSWSEEVEGLYDSITAVLTLHETKDPRDAISHIYEHTRPFGTLLVYEFRARSKDEYRKWYDKGRHEETFEEEYRKHNRWSLEQFTQICESTGFATRQARPVGHYWFSYIGTRSS